MGSVSLSQDQGFLTTRFRVSDLFLPLPSLPHELEVSPFTGVPPGQASAAGEGGLYQQQTGCRVQRRGLHLPGTLSCLTGHALRSAQRSCSDKGLQYPAPVLPGDNSLLSVSRKMKISQLGNERSLNRSAPRSELITFPANKAFLSPFVTFDQQMKLCNFLSLSQNDFH